MTGQGMWIYTIEQILSSLSVEDLHDNWKTVHLQQTRSWPLTSVDLAGNGGFAFVHAKLAVYMPDNFLLVINLSTLRVSTRFKQALIFIILKKCHLQR
jgi:hypothetical protein